MALRKLENRFTVCCTPCMIDYSPSSINTRQRSIREADQTHVFGTPLLFFGVHLGRPCFGLRGSVECCLSTGDFLWPQGAVPQFSPLRVLVLLLGNADGAEGIFGNAGRFWATALWRTHLKNGLVQNSLVRWCTWWVTGQTHVFGMSL